MSSHPDLETLADSAEGVLEPSENEQVLDHASVCVECTEALRSLAEVSAALAALPAPAMPAGVAARLDATLRNLGSAPVDPPAAASVVDLSTRRRPPARLVLGSAAACLVLLVGIAFAAGTIHLPSRDADTTAGSAAGAATSGPPILATGQDYTAADLPAQIGALVHRAEARQAASPGPAQADKADSRFGNPEAAGPSTMALTGVNPGLVQACTNAVDPDLEPLAIDLAAFDGSPAAIVVLPSERADSVEVWVMDPTCTPGLVRFFTRVQVG